MPAPRSESLTETTVPGKPLRRDAQRNREALLEAAGEHFAEHGLDAPLEHIAKRAGVAVGTLYRHFPTRMDLVLALFADKLRRWLDAAERAIIMDDAWEGFVSYVETMCELWADDRGFNDLASTVLPATACLAGTQARIHELGVQVVRRAQEEGSLRPDVTPEDLAFVVWSHSRITQATHGIAPEVWRRHLHLMFDGFRADRTHPLPVKAMSPQQVHDAMVRLGGSVCTPP